MIFILAQIMGAVSGICFMLSGAQKTHKKIMILQIVDCTAVLINNLLLAGYAGAIMSGVSLTRNILSYKNKTNTKVTAIIMIISIILTFSFMDMSILWNWLPLVASVVYTLGLHYGDCKTTKLHILINVTIWAIYNIFIKSYILNIFNVLTFIVTLQSLIKENKTKS